MPVWCEPLAEPSSSPRFFLVVYSPEFSDGGHATPVIAWRKGKLLEGRMPPELLDVAGIQGNPQKNQIGATLQRREIHAGVRALKIQMLQRHASQRSQVYEQPFAVPDRLLRTNSSRIERKSTSALIQLNIGGLRPESKS